MSIQATISQPQVNSTKYLKYYDNEQGTAYINRVFLPSENINIFPCSRRGQSNTQEGSIAYYDPEARLNTERTNRIGSAINGLTDQFIVKAYSDKLIFVLAGYYIEVKNFKPEEIATVLDNEATKIYAHLGIHTDISLQVGEYATEILYRQADGTDSTSGANYLDVQHSNGPSPGDLKGNFFVGVSFTASKLEYEESSIIGENLLLYTKPGTNPWELEQTSLLPHIEHGYTEDSIRILGELTVEDATIVNDTITAKKLIIPSNIGEDGKEKGEVKTPQLRVNRITSEDGSITIDGKKLIVNKSLEMLAPQPTTEKPNPEPAKATIEQAVIGDLTVEKKDTLKDSTGKITAKEMWLKDIGQVPALELAQLTDDVYQLRFKFGGSLEIKDERPQASE